MKPAEFRRLALSLPEVVEGSHMGHADFRVGGKIFATLGYPSDGFGVVMLSPQDQDLIVRDHPKAFAPVSGKWGASGSTTVELREANGRAVAIALEAAWRKRAPKRLASTIRLAMIVATAVLLPVDAARAQSRADSVALMRAIGASLRGEASQTRATVVCYERRNPCPANPEGSADVFMTELARSAGATVVTERSDVLPACPWGYDPPQAGAGFRLGVSTIRFDSSGDTARVTVLQRCDNPPGYTHDNFARDFEYRLARQPDAQWTVVDRRLTRIT